MAEIHAPAPVRRNGTEVLLFVFVVIAGLIFGTRTWSMSGHPETRRISMSSVQPAPNGKAVARGSMNMVERPLFRLLAFVQLRLTSRWSGSWGWAIICLTAAINLLLLPLRIHSMRSSLRMQRIQPEMDEIRARYKGVALTDPRRNEMAAEIAALQKANGIHVLGGCLPSLLQLPLLLAFFGMLRNADALRGAGWFWLHDLSAADPYHVLPLAMLVTQLLVQWFTPSPGVDATQRKMLALVTTVGFGYVSWHYASGLALYAITGSILSIVFQVLMNHSAMATALKQPPQSPA